MKVVKLYDEQLSVEIEDVDWKFLCDNRFFSDNPPIEDIQAEFGSGTGISRNKEYLWNEASRRFTEYITDLRDMQRLDLNAMARDKLTKEEKYYEFA